MSKHLPPPQNKHLKSDTAQGENHNSRKIIRNAADGGELEFSLRSLIFVIAALALLLLAKFLPTEHWQVSAGILALSFVFTVISVSKHMLSKLVSLDFSDDAVLFLISAIGIACLGEYFSAVAVMIVLDIAILAKAYTASKDRQNAERILQLRTETVMVESKRGMVQMNAKDVPVGSIIMVAPGERFALDGIVVDGMSSIDTSSLTGDKTPLAVAAGRLVVSGCMNLTKHIRVKVYRDYDDSTLTRVLDYVQNAKHFKSKQEKQIARLAKLYTPIVIALALIIGVLVPLVSGNWAQWLKRGLVLLALASPKTLLFSIPISYSGAISKAANGGAILRGSNILEALAHTETMVFDKTGTVTDGRFSIIDVCPVGMDDEKLLSIAAQAEFHSNHPIARLIKAAAGMTGKATGATILKVEELPGRGVSAFINKQQVYVGNAMLLDEHDIRYTVPNKAGSAIHVAVNNEYCGYILLNDKIKAGAFDALESVQHKGVKHLVLLTGDTRAISRPIAASLNFDMVKAELQPDGKISAVEYLLATTADNASLAFVGDAETDSAIIDRADVGIALGALGSSKALDCADLILFSNDIRKVPFAMETARLASSIVRRNSLTAIAAKALCLVLGAVGAMPLLAAAIIDVAAQLAILVNSLRTHDQKPADITAEYSKAKKRRIEE